MVQGTKLKLGTCRCNYRVATRCDWRFRVIILAITLEGKVHIAGIHQPPAAFLSHVLYTNASSTLLRRERVGGRIWMDGWMEDL
jgi:hypothetical protein